MPPPPPRGITWVLQLGGSCFTQPKGCGGSRARQTFQSLINISFPTILAGGDLYKKFLKLCKMFCRITYSLPDERVVKTAILQQWGCHTPTSYAPATPNPT